MASKRKVILKGAALSSDDDSESSADYSTDDGEVQFKIPIAAKRKPSTRKAPAATTENVAPAPALPVAPAPAKVEACLSLMQKAQDGQDVACHALLWMLNDCAAAEPTAARAAALREMLLPSLQRLEKTAGLLRRMCGGTTASMASSSSSNSSNSGGSTNSSGGGKQKKKGSPLEQAADALEQRLAKLLPAEAAAAPRNPSEATRVPAQPLAPAASKFNSKRGSTGGKGGAGSGGAGRRAAPAAPALGGLVGALQEAKGKLRKTGGKSKKRAAPNDDGSMKNELLKSLALRRAAIKATCDDDDLQSPCQSPGAFGTPSKSKKARQEN